MSRRSQALSARLLAAAGLAAGLAAAAAETPPRDLRSDTWAATDALGRRLPGFAECGPPRKGKSVGIFYFLWMERRPGQKVYDITRLLAANPTDPQYGPKHAFHFWGRPHLGYYVCDDPFVLRKHARMLTDAGVDAVIFDVTNALTYDRNVLAVCRAYREVRRTGRATPQIAFLANSHSDRVVKHLYERFYAKKLYPELWFRWKGRPLLLAPPDGLTDEHKRFFTIRRSWAWTHRAGWFGDGRDKWPWLDHYPQKPGWHDRPERPEQVPVCTAQHATSNIGRSFHDGSQPPPGRTATDRGPCFAEQWRQALKVDPEFVFITGWNEWIAQRFLKAPRRAPGAFLGRPLKPGDTFFVDQYNQEFSRDIEPMHGGHGDNYYYQMAAGIRRFKGVRRRAKASAAKTIALGEADAWANVGPELLDDVGDTAARDHPGFDAAERYVNKTGRNDFDAMKVARDATTLYFLARTREPITPPAGSSWMVPLLDTDADGKTGWAGYDFAVNRRRDAQGTCSIERNAGGWKWAPAGLARLHVEGRELHLAVPRAAVGLAAGKGKLKLDFKWTDNLPAEPTPLDFIDKGDAAPNGRFNYRYEE